MPPEAVSVTLVIAAAQRTVVGQTRRRQGVDRQAGGGGGHLPPAAHRKREGLGAITRCQKPLWLKARAGGAARGGARPVAQGEAIALPVTLPTMAVNVTARPNKPPVD